MPSAEVLQPAAENIGIEGLTFQPLRRTFATHFHGIGTIKDQQSQMRHSTAQITMDVYTQTVSESLRSAMESFDQKLREVKNEPCSVGIDSEPKSATLDNKPQEVLNPNEPKRESGLTASD